MKNKTKKKWNRVSYIALSLGGGQRGQVSLLAHIADECFSLISIDTLRSIILGCQWLARALKDIKQISGLCPLDAHLSCLQTQILNQQNCMQLSLKTPGHDEREGKGSTLVEKSCPMHLPTVLAFFLGEQTCHRKIWPSSFCVCPCDIWFPLM